MGLKVQPEVTHHEQNVLGSRDLSYNGAQILHSTPSVTNILDYSLLSGTSASGRHFLFILWFWDMGHTRISKS